MLSGSTRWIVVGFALFVGCSVFTYLRTTRSVVAGIAKDQYVAVVMNGGELFYGRVESFDAAFAVLTNVFYVQSHQDPETKQISNVLVKRGNEWHSPERTYLNASQIVFIEPVGKDSKVAGLISGSSK